MRELGSALCLLVYLFATASDSKRSEPVVPLPAAVVNAKAVFLTNGESHDLAFPAFCSEMKKWERYEIVDSPEAADLIMELRVDYGEPPVWSTDETYGKPGPRFGAQQGKARLVLTIYQAQSRQSLWSKVTPLKLWGRDEDREKVFINSAKKLSSLRRLFAGNRRQS